MSEIDLSKLVAETEEEVVNEKRADIKQTIRHVMNQIVVFEGQKKKAEQDVVITNDKLTKATEKLARLKAGDMELVKKIKQEQLNAGNQKSDGEEKK